MAFFAVFSMTAGALAPSLSAAEKEKEIKERRTSVLDGNLVFFSRYEILTWLIDGLAGGSQHRLGLVIKQLRVLEESKSLVAPGNIKV
jgi:hypothetical protein